MDVGHMHVGHMHDSGRFGRRRRTRVVLSSFDIFAHGVLVQLGHVPDVAEDRDRGLITPSVALGAEQSRQLSFLLLVLAVIIRLYSPFHDQLECAFDLPNLSAFHVVQQQVEEDGVV